MSEERRIARTSHSGKARGIRWFFTIVVIMLGVSLFVPTNYYVTRPGSAVALGPMIDVEGGKKDESGAFMLTTVRMGEANLGWYVYAQLSDEADLMQKRLVVSEGENNEDFVRREQVVMDNSQKIAEAVAFRLAGYDVQVDNQGVWIMGTIEGYAAKGVLKIGDVITAIDGVPTPQANDLLQHLSEKKAGDQVEVTYTRDGQEAKSVLTLKPLPNSQSAGIGVRPDNKQTIVIPKKVTIASQGIGGPSAGLMMALEIYDQLNAEVDLTKGYRIAGTGTISLDGAVGKIGGISHKIMAADKAGAEFFFAPEDEADPNSNYKEAVQTAERIGTTMQVIPVKNIDDALAFLQDQKQKPKQS